MKIAIAQINTTVGDFSGNLEKVLNSYKKALQKKADLVVFPELTLTGYPPKDLLEREDFFHANLSALKKLKGQIKKTACVVGFVEKSLKPTGYPLHNSLAFLHEGKQLFTYSKKLLPNYDVFDEARYFEPGTESGVFEWQGVKLGFSLCEDLWSKSLHGDRPLYKIDPFEQLVSEGAQVLINLSASPFCLTRLRQRIKLFSPLIKKAGLPFVYANLVGANDDLVFDGHSFVLDSQGRLCGKLAAFEEDLQFFDLNHLKSKKIPFGKPVQELLLALQLGLKDYLRKTGFEKAVLGLSGGIDSALTAWVAVKALGADKVLGVGMPSKFSSKSSVKDASALAKALNIEFRLYPIHELYENFKKTLNFKEGKKVSVSLQNIQARIRGNILMALSNKEGRLLISTGNKSELSLGYCTLYGDMAGGFNVLGDVPKTWVYQAAREANRQLKAIPLNTIRKPPSAELAPNQTDEDDLPPYALIDPILEAYMEKRQSPEEIVAMGYDKKVVERILRLMDHNEYKRRQAAPCIRVTSKAFGYGRRVPLAQHYRVKL